MARGLLSRGWLLLLLVSPLLLAASAVRGSRALQADSTDADVVIIGAGMAGVTAARQLADKGVKVIIVEGRDRSGGRLNSMRTKYGNIDLGAMWIHEGRAGNPLYDLVVDTLKLPISPTQDYNSVSLYRPDGGNANRMNYLPVAARWQTQVLGLIRNLRSSGTTQDVPLSDIYENFLELNPRFNEEQVWQSNTLMHTSFQTLLNANITELSTLRFGDAKTIPAIDVMLKDGFDKTIEILKKGLDIRFSTVVTNISYGGDRVSVTAADGSTLTGKYAVLTPSLGVLKKEAIQYDPPLPQYKRKAIRDMGMGVLDKLILVFDRPFWDINSDFILREAADWSGRWTSWLNVYKLFKVPVLVALNPAETAHGLEAMTDAEVVAEAMGVLRSIYGRRSDVPIPDPAESYVTRWAQDPFAYGSYSFFATGNPLNITDDLGKPTGRLLWAGEATSNKPATVLGAYLSGLREAKRLEGLLKSGDVPRE